MATSGKKIGDALFLEFKGLRARGISQKEAARQLMISGSTASKYDQMLSSHRNRFDADEVQERREDTNEAKGTKELHFVVSKPIQTLDELMEAAQVDRAVWEVSNWKCSAWSVPMKMDREGGNEPVCTQMHRVQASFRRLHPAVSAMDAIAARLEARAPKKWPPLHRRAPTDPHLLEIDLFDVHFGKLCWGKEVGEDYDLEIAESLYREAVTDLLAKASAFEIEEIVLPIGNDFFHIDNHANTTTAGTPQDTDGRIEKILEAGQLAVVWAVEYLLAVAPVRVVWVPGNHDRLTSYCLAQTIRAYFRNCPDVQVDVSPSPRKRVRYGVNLIAYTHGDGEKPESLPAIMAQEWPEDWAATTTREWRLGHRHTQAKRETLPVATSNGVTMRWLGSMCPPDSWHARRGYVGNRRVAEAYLMSKERGYTGHFNYNVPPQAQ